MYVNYFFAILWQSPQYLSEEIVVGVEAGAENLQHPLEYLSEEIVVGVEAEAENLQHPL